jgi:hypothetical protein
MDALQPKAITLSHAVRFDVGFAVQQKESVMNHRPGKIAARAQSLAGDKVVEQLPAPVRTLAVSSYQHSFRVT